MEGNRKDRRRTHTPYCSYTETGPDGREGDRWPGGQVEARWPSSGKRPGGQVANAQDSQHTGLPTHREESQGNGHQGNGGWTANNPGKVAADKKILPKQGGDANRNRTK